MDEDFIFKVSVVLLSFLSLLLPLVLFLAVWLAKLQNRVDSISSGWSVFCKLAASEENLTQPTESQPEVPNAFSTPLVIFNQQAEDSEKNISWKHITRAFAYAPADDDEDGPHPNEEESTCASEGEVKEADEESKSQEEIVPDASISVASYLHIVDDNPAIVRISSSERPATDAKHEERRRYLSVTSDDDEPLLDNNCSAENEPSAQQINSKENGILEDSQGSETGKPECVVLIEDNEKQTTEVFIEVPDVKTPMCEELPNGTATQEVERKDANGKIMDGEKVLNEGDRKHTSENHSNPSSTSEDADKAMSPHGEESKSVVPNETRPIPRPRLSKKNRRRINSEEKRKTAKRASHVDNPDETNRHSHIPSQDPDKQDRTVVIPVSAQHVHHTTAPSKTGVKSKVNTKGENQVQIANDVRHPDNRSGTSSEGIPNYESVVTSESSVTVEPNNGGNGTVTYDYATTQEVTKSNESSSVISQLGGIVRNNPRETQHLDKGSNTTARHETTKSPREDSYPVVRQETNNTNAYVKGKGKRAKRTSFPHNPDDTNRHGHDTNQHAVKQGRTAHHDASGFRQTVQQHAKAQYRTGALSKSNTKGDNEVKSVKDAEHPHNKPGTSDGGISDYEVVVTSVSGGKVEPDNKGNGKLIYDYATTQEMTESDESPSIIFQLRSLLHKNPRESHCVDKGNKTTAGYPVVRQGNEADGKYEGDKCHATTAEQDHQNTSEQIYSSVDEEGNDIYSEIPSSVAKTGATYIDQNVAHNVPDSEPFYVNLPFQQGSVNFNGGLDLRNEHGPSIYSNNDIIDI